MIHDKPTPTLMTGRQESCAFKFWCLMGVCWWLQRQKQMSTSLWVPDNSNRCSSSACEEIRAWHKAFASVDFRLPSVWIESMCLV